jgi:hypothetical protein
MGSFLYEKGNKPRHDRLFVSAQKTSIIFTSYQIFFEKANRIRTALTSWLFAFSGKQISEKN